MGLQWRTDKRWEDFALKFRRVQVITEIQERFLPITDNGWNKNLKSTSLTLLWWLLCFLYFIKYFHMMVIQCLSLYSCPPLFILFAHLMQFAIHDLSEADGSLITGSILLSFDIFFLKNRTSNTTFNKETLPEIIILFPSARVKMDMLNGKRILIYIQ